MKNGQKAAHGRLKNHVSEGREKRKRKSEDKEKKKKNNGCTLSFCIGFLRDFSDFGRKKLLDGRGLFDGNVFKTSARDINILLNLHNSSHHIQPH